MTWLYVLKDGTQVFDVFNAYAKISNQLNVKLKIPIVNNVLECKHSHY